MATVNWKVTGMTCGHCVAAVEKAARSANSVAAAQVDLESGLLAVTFATAELGAAADQIVAAVRAEGYDIE